MRNLTFPLAASAMFVSLASISIVPAARAQNPVPSYRVEVVAGRIWTNDDIDQLRAKGGISFFDEAPPAVAQTPSASAGAIAEVSFPSSPHPVRALDPEWYIEQDQLLQAELESRQDTLREYLQAIQDAKDLQHMTGGVALDKGNVGITPEAGAEILEARIGEVQSEMDDLADMARENGISPGLLRG